MALRKLPIKSQDTSSKAIGGLTMSMTDEEAIQHLFQLARDSTMREPTFQEFKAKLKQREVAALKSLYGPIAELTPQISFDRDNELIKWGDVVKIISGKVEQLKQEETHNHGQNADGSYGCYECLKSSKGGDHA